MYVRRAKITATGAIVEATLEFDPGSEAGWHVVIGSNGAGKSTLLRAVVLALLGERDAEASLVDLSRWVRPGPALPQVEVMVTQEVVDVGEGAAGSPTSSWTLAIMEDASGRGHQAQLTKGKRSPKPWEQGRGWFSAAYGAFRRMSGGDRAFDTPRMRGTRLGAHMSVLQDGFALSEAEAWLIDLHVEEMEASKLLTQALENGEFARGLVNSVAGFAGPGRDGHDAAILALLDREFRQLEGSINEGMRLGRVRAVVERSAVQEERDDPDRVGFEFEITIQSLSRRIIRFFNESGFLFDGLRIVGITHGRVSLIDVAGQSLELSQLSDGMRAVLALGLETLRLMLGRHGIERFLRSIDEATSACTLPGVVMIDEVEAHLHPPWQEEVGTWLRSRFPRVQFIVTTHSPIVCRSVARDQRIEGTVWELHPAGPDGGTIARVEGQRLMRLVFGDLVEAAGTKAFGAHVAQSDAAGAMLFRLAQLNRLSLRQDLDPKQQEELVKLRGTFPARASTTAGDA